MPTTGYRPAILTAVAAVTATLVASAAVTSAAPPPSGGAGAGAGTQQQTCALPVLGADADTVTLSGPTTLWPPNHRLVDYTLTASETAGEAGDHLPHGVTITYSVNVGSSATPSHPAQAAQASPPTGTANGDFSVPVHFQLAAQRAGNVGSTVYTINWSATFDGGPHTCSSTMSGEHAFTVTVPHDRGR